MSLFTRSLFDWMQQHHQIENQLMEIWVKNAAIKKPSQQALKIEIF